MQSDLENLKNRISSNRDLVDRVTMKIPGYQGYVEKSELYSADRIIRDHLADTLQEMKRELDSHSADLFRHGKNEILPDLESLILYVEKIMKKCRYADYGASSSHSRIKATEEDLNRILESDWRLITVLDETMKFLEKGMDEGAEDTRPFYEDIKNRLKDFEKSFDSRKNILLEVI